MERGLFQSFSKLKILKISNNSKLTSEVVKEAFQNISTTLRELALTSYNFTTLEIGVFKYVNHTNLKKVDLSGNLLLNLKQRFSKTLT